MLTRRFKFIYCLPLVPLLLGAFFVVERIRGQLSLARYQRTLVAQGEKLTLQEVVPAPAPLENGAPAVFAAAKQLVEGRVLSKSSPPRMQLTQAGRAVVGFHEPAWVDNKLAYDWVQLAADLQTNAAILTRIRSATAQPILRNPLDFSQGFKMPIQHLAPAKSLARWFGSASQLALHQGQPHQALEPLLAEIQLPRLLAEDRIVISELVRIAIAAIARADTWEALQAEGWTEPDLSNLQQAWEAQHFAEAMARSLEGERLFSLISYDLLRKSNADTFDMIYGLQQVFPPDDSERPWWERHLRLLPGGDTVADFLKKQVYCRLWRFAWLDQDERHYLESMQQLLKIVRRAAAEKSLADIRPALTQFEQDSARRTGYDRLRYPDANSPLTLTR
ncbi:MAG TPA: hypothetical protein VNT26_16165, partial [Candidatus Sulfotelmatobacter sp.]|nr:hypothetical protein [Candidatus Sulfotelmatobacter sp.]